MIDRIRSVLAPAGTLRCAINLGNPVLAYRDPASGEPAGVSVDLSRRLSSQLGVEARLVTAETAAQSVEAVRSGQADVGFFAVDPARGEVIRFTPPYLLIEGGYLVRVESPLRDNSEVDRPGRTVVVGTGSAYDLHLSRHLKSAAILRAPSSPLVVQTFLARGADVAAGVKPQLQIEADKVGGLRLLPGHFMVIEQAMGLSAGRPKEGGDFLTTFIELAKADGSIEESLERHGVRGAVIAPST